MRSRCCHTRASYAIARVSCLRALRYLTTAVGVLLETTLKEHGGRCEQHDKVNKRARSTSSSIWLSLLVCTSLSLFASSLSLSLSRRLSLRLALRLSLSLYVSLSTSLTASLSASLTASLSASLTASLSASLCVFLSALSLFVSLRLVLSATLSASRSLDLGSRLCLSCLLRLSSLHPRLHMLIFNCKP